MIHIEEGGKEGWRKLDGTVNYGDVVGVESMDEFCSKLKSVGAIYYLEIKDSPEVSECGLLNTRAAMRKSTI
jgi:hypothetical protein